MRTTLSLVAVSFIAGLGTLRAQPVVVVDHTHDTRVFEVGSAAARKQAAVQDSSAKLAPIRNLETHSPGGTRGVRCTSVRYVGNGEAAVDGVVPAASSGEARAGTEASPDASRAAIPASETGPPLVASPDPAIDAREGGDTRAAEPVPTLE
ncbi:MAG TPA: hypothetical protein VHI13_13235 [Candidatus Kapabacteria bacterium]|nr:hypothetical protein [Candidatus Kapabacteria bacterium]